MSEERERADAIELAMKFWRRSRLEELRIAREAKKKEEEENKWQGKDDIAYKRMIKNIKSVRCEECSIVLPYGTRPLHDAKDIDAPPRYLCRSCRKEQHYSPLDTRSSSSRKNSIPDFSLPKFCHGIIVEVNNIPRMILGCGSTSHDTPNGNKEIIHSPKCEVFRFKLAR